MKSFVQAAIALLALPLVAMSQPVRFNIQCLPAAQQEEIKVKAKAIEDTAAIRRGSAVRQSGSAVERSQLRADKEAKESAFSECTYNARAAGKWPGDVCLEQMNAFAAATRAYTDAEANVSRAARPVEQDERDQLQALRALYPACPDHLLPDNPVIRK